MLPRAKQSLWVEGAHHNDLALIAGQRYWKAIADFSHLVTTH